MNSSAEPLRVTLDADIDPGERSGPRVSAATLRKRRQRAREPLFTERQDWTVFLDLETLPQKAGCQAHQLRELVMRELVDNALDNGSKAELVAWPEVDGGWIVRDDGPGINLAMVPKLFAVNRPLISSKRKRLPLRGMLGNGLRVVMGAVAATEGRIVIETRGRRLELATDGSTGETVVLTSDAVGRTPGCAVSIMLGPSYPLREVDMRMARCALRLAECGTAYCGHSSPWWYSAKDLHHLFCHVGREATVTDVLADLGFELADGRPACKMSKEQASEVLEQLRECNPKIKPELMGRLGPNAFLGVAGYACNPAMTSGCGAHLPYIVECWAICDRPERKGRGEILLSVYMNRTPIAAKLHARSGNCLLMLSGCGLKDTYIDVATGDYVIELSIVVPYMRLLGDGKEPDLTPFSESIMAAVKKACGQAHRAVGRPPAKMTIKEAAWHVMSAAYMHASSENALPANARQIMYAARPLILALTGAKKLDDKYFTQKLLPDYMAEHSEDSAGWDVVFDNRGGFVEPHTGRDVKLGTIEVRDYLAREPLPPAEVVSASVETFQP